MIAPPIIEVSPIDRFEREYSASVVLASGGAGVVGTLTFAVVLPGEDLTSATTWKTFPVTTSTARVTYAAPAATAEITDLKIPRAGCDVYAREIQGALTKAILVDRFKVK